MRLRRIGPSQPLLVKGRAILQKRPASQIASPGTQPSFQWYVAGDFIEVVGLESGT